MVLVTETITILDLKVKQEMKAYYYPQIVQPIRVLIMCWGYFKEIYFENVHFNIMSPGEL